MTGVRTLVPPLVCASCILPLVLHEMGAYELIRINMELFSHAHSIFCPWLMISRLRLLYLDEMGGMTIPMPKIFMIFTILSMTSFALIVGHEWFCCRIDSFLWNNY
ncbi:NAD(P)H-quinone oxidoreductase chain 4, putative [Medicago truncatula]|uniref:NAD(P)H-quinone oxidoreductase chain 4, putative n=1 Tax=Medicago truncatula TaxID=3880 RepID=G7L480_MEDTR|nr:NAD(P)H-quinone oxidoreductase chain 4, putative [Medicago truncatula]